MPKDVRAGESTQLLFRVVITNGWYIYGLEQKGGPTPTSITLVPGSKLVANGKPIEPPPKRKWDNNFGVNVTLHEGVGIFALPVKVDAKARGAVKGKVEIVSQACSSSTCVTPEKKPFSFALKIAPGAARPDRVQPVISVPKQPEKSKQIGATSPAPPKDGGSSVPEDKFASQLTQAQQSGFAAYLLLAFTAGLLALLTPCVFPMIPITVSFFSKKADEGKRVDYRGAIAYCGGIVLSFTALGLLVTILYGATGIQRLATNPWLNLGIAALFLVLAAGLFGVYELALPPRLVNLFGSKRGGIAGVMFMGITFTLTSWTCTLPFVGSLLVTATQGSLVYPMFGMMAFSAAFSLPFFMLALFPQLLSKLPKSGSWLSSVKATMGLLEIAAVIKFISNADLVWQLGLLTRPVFLALWAAICIFGGLYLIGWIRLGNENTKPRVGLPRYAFGFLFFLGALYSLAGMQGGKLGELASFLPPDPYPGRIGSLANQPIVWEKDLEKAKLRAASERKLIFVNFTGVTCTNCRWMEQNMFPNPQVLARINGMVPLELYTDRGTPGDLANRKLQQELTRVVTLPVYVIATPEGKPIKIFQGSTRDRSEFIAFLETPEMRLASN